jgi:hypothetical protein
VLCRFRLAREDDRIHCQIVLDAAVPYKRAQREHHMAILARVFTTRTLLQIIFVLTATVIMKAMSTHYDFSWATALAAG